MTWTAKPQPDVGDRILTLKGPMRITSIDQMRDLFMTGVGELQFQEVHPLEAPIGGTAEQMEMWLGCPWQVIRSRTTPCTCSCGKDAQGCEHMVVERGDQKTVNHVASPRCTCGDHAECCGMMLA